jgi:transcriptional regulator with XRE-family HTH domain
MSKLHTYLAETGTTQSDLAGRVGVSKGYMSEIVGGQKRPGLDVAFAIERETGGMVPAACWVDAISAQAAAS